MAGHGRPGQSAAVNVSRGRQLPLTLVAGISNREA
jgi:hypothetical protein